MRALILLASLLALSACGHHTIREDLVETCLGHGGGTEATCDAVAEASIRTICEVGSEEERRSMGVACYRQQDGSYMWSCAGGNVLASN